MRRWDNDRGERFSTKSIRQELELKGTVPSDCGCFKWNAWAPLKVNYLVWRAELRRIADKLNLVKRGINITNNLCSRCGINEESSDHLFVSCLWAKAVWWNIQRWLKISVDCEWVSVSQIFEHISVQVGSKKWKQIVQMVAMACMWRLWLARNVKEFNDNIVPVQTIVELTKEESFLWMKNRAKGISTGWNEWVTFDISAIL
ncbi:uncharacterized protein LOC110892768 [Helianthus annuus]|uniref:uncharacterized protein LOC110892768 n=1 Tax=Helianthus annuus TaxID=4232 RepID=UPI000B8FC3A8|nr:uncharacterized protein LOC110892768 [Helianthus annuus]